MKIIKKQLPEKIANKLARPHEDEEFSTYYLIDDEIYVHTKFLIEEENPPLTLMHDVARVEEEMIKHMQSIQKIYTDDEKVPFFDLYELGLWFYENIPSKDWVDLLSFLRILREYNELTTYIKFPGDVQDVVH